MSQEDQPAAALAVPTSPQQDLSQGQDSTDASSLDQTSPATAIGTADVPISAPAPIHPPVVVAPIPPAAAAATSSPLDTVNAAQRPPIPSVSSRGSGLNISQDITARMKAFHLSRQGPRPAARSSVAASDSALPIPPGGVVPSRSPATLSSPPEGALVGGIPANLRLPNGKPVIANLRSAPAVPGVRLNSRGPSLADKRGMALPGGLPGTQNGTPVGGARKKPGLTLSQMGSAQKDPAGGQEQKPHGTMMDKYADFLDPKTGTLQFKGKATLSSTGVEFASGSSFSISLDEVDTLDELGKGNYGTVYKVRHSRPKIRRPGLGLAGNKAVLSTQTATTRKSLDTPSPEDATPPTPTKTGGTTGAVMAMKEIRLELDDAKFAAIIMELEILHKCVSPYIIDFYGAFFQEGAVYICMEFMDGGSIDKLYGDGIPENVLRKIAFATTMGLKSLKDEHNIIHRDVKPTNILMNTKGQIKICDFGVSGNLVASIAKTNIGCQSYMAPERISSGGISVGAGTGTYSVQSDIWSLGLTIIECALGRYPYPPETYNNIFSQLSAIVDGNPPDLPPEGYSDVARNFVSGCLNKIPKLRPTYAMLLQHVWLAPLLKPTTIVEEDEDEDAIQASEQPAPESPTDIFDKEVADWVIQAIEKRRQGKLGKSEKPALHAAPLDAVATPSDVPKKADVKKQILEEAAIAVGDKTADAEADPEPAAEATPNP